MKRADLEHLRWKFFCLKFSTISNRLSASVFKKHCKIDLSRAFAARRLLHETEVSKLMYARQGWFEEEDNS
jgi:hypothetical protein